MFSVGRIVSVPAPPTGMATTLHSSIRTVRKVYIYGDELCDVFWLNKNSLKRASQRAAAREREKEQIKKEEEFNGQRVALRTKWSSHVWDIPFIFYGLMFDSCVDCWMHKLIERWQKKRRKKKLKCYQGISWMSLSAYSVNPLLAYLRRTMRLSSDSLQTRPKPIMYRQAYIMLLTYIKHIIGLGQGKRSFIRNKKALCQIHAMFGFQDSNTCQRFNNKLPDLQILGNVCHQTFKAFTSGSWN